MDFIIGYDIERRTFISRSYADNKIWKNTDISFDEFESAFYSSENKTFKVFVYKAKSKVKKEFNFKLVYIGTRDYYKSKLSMIFQILTHSISISKNECYGIDTYDYLARLIEVSGEEGNGGLPISKLQAFLEFKKCMVLRLKFMQNQGYLSDIDDIIHNYEQIEDEFLIIRNMGLKYEITNDQRTAFKIVDKIKKLKEIEIITSKFLLLKMRDSYMSFKDNQ